MRRQFLKERGEASLSHCAFHLQAQRTNIQKKSRRMLSHSGSAQGCNPVSPPSQQPRAKSVAREWEQDTLGYFLSPLSPSPMIYISGAFRYRSGILYLKVTVFTNESQSFMLKCKFLPATYVGFYSEALSKNQDFRNRCI